MAATGRGGISSAPPTAGSFRSRCSSTSRSRQRRTVTPQATFGEPLASILRASGRSRRIASAATPTGPLAVAQLGPPSRRPQRDREEGAGGRDEPRGVPPAPRGSRDGEITALRLDGRGRGSVRGDLAGPSPPVRPARPDEPGRRWSTVTVGSGAPVTALGFLLGDRTLVVGDARGGVSTWQVVPPPEGGEPRLTRVYEFAPHTGPVVAISASARDKGFVTADAAGQVHLRYGTSGPTLLSPRAPGGDLRSRRVRAQGRRCARRGRQGELVALAGRQPASRDHAQHRLREGLVRGLRGARIRLAVHRWHGRLRGEVQPDPAHLRHAQGNLLRPPLRGAAGAARRARTSASSCTRPSRDT